MKYKVGDKVRILDLHYESPKAGKSTMSDDNFLFSSEMTKYFGMEATITEKDEFENYKIDIDNGKFTWAAYLFENTELDSDEKLIISQDLIKDIAELIKKYNLGVSVTESEGKLIIEPLKVENDLPFNTPVVVKYEDGDWTLRRYLGNLETIDINGDKDNTTMFPWNFIIPFDKFNPNDIQDSLKYNIV